MLGNQSVSQIEKRLRIEFPEDIKEKMKQFALNIDEFSIGQTIIDTDGAHCKITNKTINTIEVFINKKISNCQSCKKGKIKKEIEVRHKKWWKRIFGIKMKTLIDVKCEYCNGSGKNHYGIDSANWFDMKEFNKRFKILKT